MAALEHSDQLEHHFVDLAGVRLHYVAAGHGPLVVLLHGFPEFWYSWRHQLPALARAGFHAVAPDMRGYNLSSKPPGVAAYDLDPLASDIVGLIGALDAPQAVVVGHNWGGMVAWYVAMRHPHLVDRLVVMNAPHPARLFQALRSPGQLLRSAYVVFFQLPWLPETAMEARDFALLRYALRTEPLRPGTFTEEDIDRYVEATAQPGALTSTINYYRALRQTPGRLRARLRRIEVPVQVIWGERDLHLLPWLAEPSPDWVPHARVERLADASHWVQNDRPERVNALLLEFLEAFRARTGG